MSSFDALIQDLVIANRILAKQEVVDAYGHVSVRHPDKPDRFLIARSLAPELVSPEDIVELELDGQPERDEGRNLYLERFIHAAIFAARPNIIAVVHAHVGTRQPDRSALSKTYDDVGRAAREGNHAASRTL
jgi:ribulose-5-phosphate 4-epimerase/fuculose-1-phosphate aldolase